jgi:hypothetical protein
MNAMHTSVASILRPLILGYYSLQESKWEHNGISGTLCGQDIVNQKQCTISEQGERLFEK